MLLTPRHQNTQATTLVRFVNLRLWKARKQLLYILLSLTWPNNNHDCNDWSKKNSKYYWSKAHDLHLWLAAIQTLSQHQVGLSRDFSEFHPKIRRNACTYEFYRLYWNFNSKQWQMPPLQTCRGHSFIMYRLIEGGRLLSKAYDFVHGGREWWRQIQFVIHIVRNSQLPPPWGHLQLLGGGWKKGMEPWRTLWNCVGT